MTSCVTIPVYKSNPSKAELASFIQCYKILDNYDIFIFTHKDCSLDVYQDAATKKLKVKYFDSDYFKDIYGYNRLMLNPKFYAAFMSYDYLLIYQLDAWVFKDELQYWTDMKYDYIGAPWVLNYSTQKSFNGFAYAGNGGFSLRKIDSFLKVLNTFSFIEKPKDAIKEILERKTLMGKIRGFIKLPLRIFYGNNTIAFMNHFKENEDFFWAKVASSNFKWFRNAHPEIAIKFSFEMFPQECFKLNDEKLPFGCHAWEKYSRSFWKDYIKLN